MIRIKVTLLGVAMLAVMAFTAGSASAQTVSPAGPFTATSSSFGLAAGSNIGCGSTVIKGSMGQNGTGTASTFTFSGCKVTSSAVWTGAPVTITALAPWNVAITKGSGTSEVTTFSNIRLHVAFPATGGACSYDVEGSALGTSATSTISSWSFAKEYATPRLFVRNSQPACYPEGLEESTSGWLTGALALSTPLTVTN